jgi:hypothetical protein
MELAWGYATSAQDRSRRFSLDGARERKSILQLVEIFNHYGIIPTWALVGHLFFQRCERCPFCPILEIRGTVDDPQEIYDSGNPLWYGEDLINTLVRNGADHEFAFHGYTHAVFDEKIMDTSAARIEIEEWLRLGYRKQVIPRAVVFPRNKVGHLKLFKEFGFICYRGEIKPHPYFSFPLVGRTIRKVYNLISSLLPPSVYSLPGIDPSGLINLPSTEYFFGRYRRFERWLDLFGLHHLSVQNMVKSVRRAAAEKKILHIRAHPCEFQTEMDFNKLHYLLGTVEKERNQGRMRTVGMTQLARDILRREQATN